MRHVSDASVGIKWFVPEIHSAHARILLDGRFTLLVPDFFYLEVANILWKRVQRGDDSETRATATLQLLSALPLDVHPVRPLVAHALHIACREGRSVYDSLYLALAVREGAPMVTADQRLYNAVQSGPLAAHIVWIEDIR